VKKFYCSKPQVVGIRICLVKYESCFLLDDSTKPDPICWKSCVLYLMLDIGVEQIPHAYVWTGLTM
jgi:hypothetical protein